MRGMEDDIHVLLLWLTNARSSIVSDYQRMRMWIVLFSVRYNTRLLSGTGLINHSIKQSERTNKLTKEIRRMRIFFEQRFI
jgi:hypothetical protein